MVVYGWVEFSPDHWGSVLRCWLDYRKMLWREYRVATMAAHYRCQLADGELRPTSRLDAVRLREVGERALRRLDPGARSFVNVNAREDLEAARALLGRASGATAPARRPGRSPRGSSAGG